MINDIVVIKLENGVHVHINRQGTIILTGTRGEAKNEHGEQHRVILAEVNVEIDKNDTPSIKIDATNSNAVVISQEHTETVIEFPIGHLSKR